MQVPDSPLDLGLEGFPQWRENQQQAVQDIVDAFSNSSDRVLLEAPTGAGKTIIGAAVARMLGGQGALYLSHTINLQNQQLHTLPGAVTCTGRGNHLCLNDTGRMLGMTAADADCPCALAVPGGCGYYSQWFEAMAAEDVVLNYAFAVRVLKSGGLRVWGPDGPEKIENPFHGRGLMVCDEGHNLESALLDADGVDIYQRNFEKHGFQVPRSLDIKDWFNWHNDAGLQIGEAHDTAKQSRLANPSMDNYKQEQSLRGLKQTITNLGDLAGAHKDTPVFVGRTPFGYRIRPLWAWNRSNKILFRHAPSTLVMSATLGNPATLARLLGLENWTHIRIPSTFPVANRPVFYWPVARMKHGMPEEDKQRQAVALVHLANKFRGVRGVVHCNSFALGKYLADVAGSLDSDVASRLVSHTSATRERIFKAFEEGTLGEDAILITPSATTGVDWDFVGWQMIPKVPFPDLGDEFTRLRYDYVTDAGEPIGKEVFQQEACKTLVQAAGRCVRTPVSKGVTIITDSTFWPLFKYTAPKAFPDWFRAAVKWYTPGG